MRKLIIVTLIAIFYSPFGQIVQAENTVNNMFDDAVEIPNEQDDSASNNNTNQTQPEREIGETAPPEFESQFSYFDFVKMFLALGVVIALIYIVLRFINKKNQLFGQMRAMENLGGLPLGTNKSIQLVRIGERVFVVGVGESIQLLKEITSPEEIEQLTTQNQSQSPTLQIGQTILNKWLPSKEQQKDQGGTSMDFSNVLKEQLKDLSEGRKKIYDKFKKDQDE